LYEIVKEMLLKLDKTEPSFKNKEITLRDNLISFAHDEAYIDELYRWYFFWKFLLWLKNKIIKGTKEKMTNSKTYHR